uniref:Uncharacterized protein n=1 Tax=Trypanosoma vivax (strain Y486) TaxID=1055687 RepID=G0UBF1_TRYVY|nr:hypothetical protein TVY486_1106300 [Trypanosoma vivax Y486]
MLRSLTAHPLRKCSPHHNTTFFDVFFFFFPFTPLLYVVYVVFRIPARSSPPPNTSHLSHFFSTFLIFSPLFFFFLFFFHVRAFFFLSVFSFSFLFFFFFL